jgi:hypothetical protein
MTVINFCFLIVKLTFLQVNEAIEDDSYRSSEDSDFDKKESDSDSVDLSDFLEEDEEDLQALKEEAKQDMSSKKAATRRSTIKKSPKKDSVDDVMEQLENTTLASSANYSCTYVFPWSQHREKDGVKDIVHVEFQTANLPTSYLRLAKVLPGGMKFATCMAAPKWFFEEGYLRTLMGADWSEDHARVQSRNEMVIQPIRMRTSGLERWVMGEAQVLDLPFKCIEGDVVPHWGNWRTAGVEDITVTDEMGNQVVHMQYQRTMSFRLVSMHDNRERLGGQQATVFGYAHGEQP